MMFDHALEGAVGGITKCTRHPVISPTSHAVFYIVSAIKKIGHAIKDNINAL